MQCVLCEGGMRHVGQDFAGKQIYRCDACEYAASPSSVLADAVALYDDPEYFGGWGCNAEFDYDRFNPNIQRQTRQYVDFISAYTRGTILLDVGTGHGLLPYVARSRGYEVEGTDLSKYICDNLPPKVGFAVHHGALEEIEFTRKYDIITMFNVLEHTRSPASTLARCKELLNKGGYVVVVAPNYRSVDCRVKDFLSRYSLKSRAYKHLALGHHNYIFSLRSLELLGKKCGLQVVHQQTRQPPWRASWLHRLLERYQLAALCWIVYRSE